MSKKGQGLPLTTIIIAVLVVVVLIVIVAFFLSGSSSLIGTIRNIFRALIQKRYWGILMRKRISLNQFFQN